MPQHAAIFPPYVYVYVPRFSLHAIKIPLNYTMPVSQHYFGGGDGTQKVKDFHRGTFTVHVTTIYLNTTIKWTVRWCHGHRVGLSIFSSCSMINMRVFFKSCPTGGRNLGRSGAGQRVIGRGFFEIQLLDFYSTGI